MNIEKIEEICDSISEVQESFSKFRSVLSSGPSSYYFEKLKDYYRGCMAASKFKVGDRVKLLQDIDLSRAPSWGHCKHFLKKNAIATVHSADYYKGEYSYDLVFDNETYISDINPRTYKRLKKPVERPVKEKHTFHFCESELKKA